MLTPNTEITKIQGIGNTIAKRLKGLGLITVRDLLYYFPFRYSDFSEQKNIAELKAGEEVNVQGQIEIIQNKRSPRKRMNITEALLSDDSGQIKIIWFNQPFIAKNLGPGDRVSLAGKVEEDFSGLLFKSPAYEKINNGRAVHTQGIIPNYHLTANVTQKQIRFLIAKVIDVAGQIEDWLLPEITERQKLLSLPEAIEKIHFPKNQSDLESAKKRLGFDELFLIQLQSQIIKHDLQKSQAPVLKFREKATKEFVAGLPFKLTDAQKKASWEIIQDLQKPIPMARLLEGDVGSGKTLVAIMALLTAALNKKQAVLMVPTEILAKQHFQSIGGFLKKNNLGIALLTNSEQSFNQNIDANSAKTKTKAKQAIFELIKSGKADIVIGTHALIQEKIEFKNLALAIIDEQHRFGVEQRKILIEKSREGKKDKNYSPHLLSMTATPIPRSLALTIYGDLNISIINEMPLGRKKIITRAVSEENRQQAYDFIRGLIHQGRQVFVICPLIDPSDKLGVKSVTEEFKKIDKEIFPDIETGLLHGRLKAKEKDRIMDEFLKNKIKILVSTSVVEVGVDIKNASVMMIEGADRFGLAQLHQFRGRVGRGEHQSYCFLFSESDSPKTKARLSAMEKYSDGFSLAKIDLAQRGPGEVYGTAQKGFPELKIASLFDYALIKSARDEAEKIIKSESGLKHLKNLQDKINISEKLDFLRG